MLDQTGIEWAYVLCRQEGTSRQEIQSFQCNQSDGKSALWICGATNFFCVSNAVGRLEAGPGPTAVQ